MTHPQSASAPLSTAADQQMLAIPAGQYIAGSTPEERAQAYDDYTSTAHNDVAREHQWFDGEDDRHVAHSVAFRIDLMPVTQAEYGEFVTATGAPAPAIDEATWKKQGYIQDYATQVARFNWKDGAPPQGRADHPVVLVTWDEARRYCAWRGEQVGQPRRLASADEYEKAARGTEGLAYPWGNTFDPDLLDSAVKGPGDTVPVGGYVKGASPFGMLDAAGNVFEWTMTPFKKGQIMVKGSSWEDFGGLGRAASRHGRPPEIRHAIIGFRCAADAPPPP
ncbi:MAG: SUMF1/EgtB/PvdO family nonheme iron enzyme [Deltaproteobacteria bacterium]|nr:SUMF1/EgtB/PvdO family nonheme iron enzyme [Deltaproteobacteria bacterium]